MGDVNKIQEINFCRSSNVTDYVYVGLQVFMYFLALK
jgi:hypothetical protein